MRANLFGVGRGLADLSDERAEGEDNRWTKRGRERARRGNRESNRFERMQRREDRGK